MYLKLRHIHEVVVKILLATCSCPSYWFEDFKETQIHLAARHFMLYLYSKKGNPLSDWVMKKSFWLQRVSIFLSCVLSEIWLLHRACLLELAYLVVPKPFAWTLAKMIWPWMLVTQVWQASNANHFQHGVNVLRTLLHTSPFALSRTQDLRSL